MAEDTGYVKVTVIVEGHKDVALFEFAEVYSVTHEAKQPERDSLLRAGQLIPSSAPPAVVFELRPIPAEDGTYCVRSDVERDGPVLAAFHEWVHTQFVVPTHSVAADGSVASHFQTEAERIAELEDIIRQISRTVRSMRSAAPSRKETFDAIMETRRLVDSAHVPYREGE